MIAAQAGLADDVDRGIELCRRGDWERGLVYLGRVAQSGERSSKLSGLFYSYLGYGLARTQGRIDEGLRLCHHAVKAEFYQPENYLNLARTHLLAKNRRAAVRALADGLKIDPNSTGLLTLKRELGVRRSPVLPFLSRTNPLNVFLGSLRHKLRS